MPSIPLPEHASFEHLQNQAKLVRDLVHQGDDGALDMVAEFHPRHTSESVSDPGFDPASIKLADAQLMVARLYGFDQWGDLRPHLDLIAEFGRSPGSAGVAASASDEDRPPDVAAADELVALACLDYGPDNPRDRLASARTLLAERPELAVATAVAAAATGSFDALRAALDHGDADLVTAEVGPNRWPLILYCCYSRVFAESRIGDGGREGDGSLACVELLLDRGADPDAGFLWNGLVPPFTALTGAFGHGEQAQPPHPRALELARLLLEAGADPNDGQALYNNGPAGSAPDDASHLELLVSYGLGTDRNGPWYRRFGRRLTPPDRLLADELALAADGRPNRMRFLLELRAGAVPGTGTGTDSGTGTGADLDLDVVLDLDRPVGRHGLTPARIAARGGHREVLALLADAGVDVSLQPEERFLMAAKSGSVAELTALIDARPDLVEQMRATSPGLVAEVASIDRLPTLRALLDLGFDIDQRSTSGRTALHWAATANNPELVEALLALGADPNIADAHIGAKPLGWALYNHADAAAAILAPVTNTDDGSG